MSKINTTLSIFIAFVAMFVIAFFAVGFDSTVQAPNTTTLAGQQYANLTNSTVPLVDTGVNATLILVAFALVMSGVVGAGFYLMSRKR